METRSQVPAVPTAIKALVCLEQIALEKGLDALSMRDVAKSVGISLAALQHHYPSKAALIDGFINHKMIEYTDHCNRLLAMSEGKDQFARVVRYAVEEALADLQGSMWPMLEGRAQHDEVTAHSLRQFMRHYIKEFQRVIGEDFPDLSQQEALLAATLIISMFEGINTTHEIAHALGIDDVTLLQARIDVALMIPELMIRFRQGR
ncbi:MAG: TetR/AcrR family transcriptional regulator [Candidatus Competibacterales bacterium]